MDGIIYGLAASIFGLLLFCFLWKCVTRAETYFDRNGDAYYVKPSRYDIFCKVNNTKEEVPMGHSFQTEDAARSELRDLAKKQNFGTMI